jgi:hypothetical protein
MSSQSAQALSRQATVRSDQSGLYSLVLSAAQVTEEFANDGDVYEQDEATCDVEVVTYPSDSSHAPVSNSFTNASVLSKHLSAFSSKTGEEPNRVMFVIYCIAVSKAYDNDIRFLHQQDSWEPLSTSKGVIEALRDHFELSSGFLRILTSFRSRYLPTEEAFSGSIRTIAMHNRSGR